MDTTILDHPSQLPIPAPLCSPRAPVFLGATVHSIHELPTFLKATPTPLHKKYTPTTPSTETLPHHHIPLMLYYSTHSCTQLFVSSLRAPCPTYRQYPKELQTCPSRTSSPTRAATRRTTTHRHQHRRVRLWQRHHHQLRHHSSTDIDLGMTTETSPLSAAGASRQLCTAPPIRVFRFRCRTLASCLTVMPISDITSPKPRHPPQSVRQYWIAHSLPGSVDHAS